MVRHIRQEFGDTFTICVAGMKISVFLCLSMLTIFSMVWNLTLGSLLACNMRLLFVCTRLPKWSSRLC